MILVHSSTVAAILCQLLATSNPKTVGGVCSVIIGTMGLASHHATNYEMCYAIKGMIGLTSHHGTNYK